MSKYLYINATILAVAFILIPLLLSHKKPMTDEESAICMMKELNKYGDNFNKKESLKIFQEITDKCK